MIPDRPANPENFHGFRFSERRKNRGTLRVVNGGYLSRNPNLSSGCRESMV